jgi:hypothetical protein
MEIAPDHTGLDVGQASMILCSSASPEKMFTEVLQTVN